MKKITIDLAKDLYDTYDGHRRSSGSGSIGSSPHTPYAVVPPQNQNERQRGQSAPGSTESRPGPGPADNARPNPNAPPGPGRPSRQTTPALVPIQVNSG